MSRRIERIIDFWRQAEADRNEAFLVLAGKRRPWLCAWCHRTHTASPDNGWFVCYDEMYQEEYDEYERSDRAALEQLFERRLRRSRY